MAWNTVWLRHWHVIALDLALETSPELVTQLPQGSLLVSSLEPSFSWSQGTFLLPDM